MKVELTKIQLPEGHEAPNLQQLRWELAQEMGLERGPTVHYDPDVGTVEVRSADARVPGIVAGHAPDRRSTLPPGRRELLELIDERERGAMPEGREKRLYDLLLAHVKKELGG
jgi:hypothetical protein